jgi:hypothetical protein
LVFVIVSAPRHVVIACCSLGSLLCLCLLCCLCCCLVQLGFLLLRALLLLLFLNACRTTVKCNVSTLDQLLYLIQLSFLLLRALLLLVLNACSRSCCTAVRSMQ